MDGTCELHANGQLTLFVASDTPSVSISRGKLVVLSRRSIGGGTQLRVQTAMPAVPKAAIVVAFDTERFELPLASDAYPPRLRAYDAKWTDDPKAMVRAVDSIDPANNHVLKARLLALRARAMARLGLAQDAVSAFSEASATLFDARRLSEALDSKLQQIRLEIETTRAFDEARAHLDGLKSAVPAVPALQVEYDALNAMLSLRRGDISAARGGFRAAHTQALRLGQYHESEIYLAMLEPLTESSTNHDLGGCAESVMALRHLDAEAATEDVRSARWQAMAGDVESLTRSRCQDPLRRAAVFMYMLNEAALAQQPDKASAYLNDVARFLPKESDVRLAFTHYVAALRDEDTALQTLSHLDELARLAPDRFPWTRLARAQALQRVGRGIEAAELYGALHSSRAPSSKDARIHLMADSIPLPSALSTAVARKGLSQLEDAERATTPSQAATNDQNESAMTNAEARAYWLTRDKAMQDALDAFRRQRQAATE